MSYILERQTNSIKRKSDGLVVWPLSDENQTEHEVYQAWANEHYIELDVVEIGGYVPPVPVVADYEFRDKFTEEEIIDILHLAYDDKDDIARKGLLLLQTASDGVPLNREDVNDLLNYFVYRDILTEERKRVILVT